ncbi:methyltransferase domain-containing protein [Qipengyuania sp. GH25]|uniref:Methyltransferase domain-containing protein n=1 Tax=Qipengyuania pacifica TaxID=2860199 RepID=A0ABS7JIV9_9SPHN|nr:class I SAM-dependent methyltransferase [Qipengyuania aerophila]MBX7488628.1 methyltransferase domain-containing protein [Qipengyuania aerophila]
MAEPDQAAFWDERYATGEYLFGTAPNAFLAREVHGLAPGSKVLAIADGEGRNSVFLAQHGHRVVATDVSARALDKARALAKRRGVEVEYWQVNLAEWEWPAEAFDAVVGIFRQFAGPGLREDIFDGIHRSLKRGGLLLLEGYREEQLAFQTGGPPSICGDDIGHHQHNC